MNLTMDFNIDFGVEKWKSEVGSEINKMWNWNKESNEQRLNCYKCISIKGNNSKCEAMIDDFNWKELNL